MDLWMKKFFFFFWQSFDPWCLMIVDKKREIVRGKLSWKKKKKRKRLLLEKEEGIIVERGNEVLMLDINGCLFYSTGNGKRWNPYFSAEVKGVVSSTCNVVCAGTDLFPGRMDGKIQTNGMEEKTNVWCWTRFTKTYQGNELGFFLQVIHL